MDYTGKMKNFGSERGAVYFTLGGKDFVGCGADVLRKLRSLVGRKITLSTSTNDWFSNNRDHQFIEDMKRVAPNHYAIELGS